MLLDIESHPAWVCGLKLRIFYILKNIGMSHPAWVCGLKHRLVRPSTSGSQVTPCVGVWIETVNSAHVVYPYLVTPCVGVWIETMIASTNTGKAAMSHPAWVCGLKLPIQVRLLLPKNVTPCVGVWIETKSGHTITYDCGASHPAWVCGLKLT